MKHTLTIVLFSLFLASTAQVKVKIKIADRKFSRFDYLEAIPMYEQIVAHNPDNQHAKQRLADCYRLTNDAVNAERWYGQLITLTDPKPENILYYAQALARNGKYNEARYWYLKYSELVPDDQKGKVIGNAYNNIGIFFTDSVSYAIQKADFNTQNPEFSPMYYKDGLVFVAARYQPYTLIQRIYNWNKRPYFNLMYYSRKDTDSVTYFSKQLNTRYHEGPVCFSKDEKTIYFTRNNYYNRRYKKSKDGINKLKIYISSYNPDLKEWYPLTQFPHNSDEYSTGHPALSPDEKRLYFASDMPGGYGMADLYYSELREITDSAGTHLTWDKPVNLGPNINTTGNELFPYIDKNNILFFSSDGHPGLGGLDLFMVPLDRDSLPKPINMGYPLNSDDDDFGMIYNDSEKSGYFTSDRKNVPGDDDIYRFFKIAKKLKFYTYDKTTGKPIEKAEINIYSEGQFIDRYESNKSGVVIINAQPRSYQLVTRGNGYEEDTLLLTANDVNANDQIDNPLSPLIFTFTGQVISEEDQKPLTGAKATLTRISDRERTYQVADSNGSFTFNLSANDDFIIGVELPGKKCSNASSEISTKGLKTSRNLTGIFALFCVGDIITIENIYYDVNKSDIRPDAAIELDKLLVILNKYPKMKIELRSHTDSRGSDAYNLKLSDDRAKAAAAYLVSKGIDAARIIGRGYGELVPLNHCKNNVKCSEEEYQQNRRTEFKILSIE